MTFTEQLITILMISLGTMAMRFLPFILFPAGKPTPKYIVYLGRVLPGAIFGMLVIYCLKNVDLLAYPYGIPELIGIAVTVILHLWKKQMILSIIAGTAVYMLLIR